MSSSPLPLPSADEFSDQASLLGRQQHELTELIAADLSRIRGMAFLCCASLLSLCVAAGSAFGVYAAVEGVSAEDRSSVLLTSALLLAAMLALGMALFLIRRGHQDRWRAIRHWATLDRQPGAPRPHGSEEDQHGQHASTDPESALQQSIAVNQLLRYGTGLTLHRRVAASGTLCLFSVVTTLLIALNQGVMSPASAAACSGFTVFALCMACVAARIGGRGKWCNQERETRYRMLTSSRG
ncbi:hypothetical protein ABZ929_01465 [Streptomyces physcomitrii]|uniref:hypothetical protein n=1 Tax=Streptomyces physcomitrii TaxID=2724184 RepID=UPI0033E73117